MLDLATCDPQIQYDPTPGCCGPTICDKCISFNDFMNRARLLYPDMGGQLAMDGVFDGVMQSLAKPLFDLYQDHCGLCDIEREMNPCKSCCLTDCWIEEYGLPDDCFGDELFAPCWLDESQRRVSLKAQLCARFAIEWNGHQDYAFFENIGTQLGIKFDIVSPTPNHRVWDTPMCDVVMDWPVEDEVDEDFADPDHLVGVTKDPDYICYRPKICFQIWCAPKTTYSTICSPLSQPFCWNPYIDSFKCLVRQYLPCHYQVRFEEDITAQCEPAALDDLCPDECGRYKGRELDGTGSPTDPFKINWNELSQDHVKTIVERLCCLGTV